MRVPMELCIGLQPQSFCCHTVTACSPSSNSSRPSLQSAHGRPFNPLHAASFVVDSSATASQQPCLGFLATMACPRGGSPGRRQVPRMRAHSRAEGGDSEDGSAQPRPADGERTEESQSERDTLTAEFMRFVAQTKQAWPLEGRNPTALMPPTAVVRVQMEALMRNDWPEEDSGIQTAFKFSMPARVDELLAGQTRPPVSAVRVWEATERYVTLEQFREVVMSPMYRGIVNCASWELSSPLTFHGPGDERAVQAVRVRSSTEEGGEKESTFTFCLQKVKVGAYKGCWMVVGLRIGDYANV